LADKDKVADTVAKVAEEAVVDMVAKEEAVEVGDAEDMADKEVVPEE
jgi:hypothetical protein